MVSPHHPCDCLDLCGDDPRVRAGKLPLCPEGQQRKRDLAEAGERFALQRDLALDGALALLRAEAEPYTGTDGITWLCIDAGILPAERAALARAARYLLLTRNAVQHPSRPTLLRLVGPATQQGPSGPVRNPHA